MVVRLKCLQIKQFKFSERNIVNTQLFYFSCKPTAFRRSADSCFNALQFSCLVFVNRDGLLDQLDQRSSILCVHFSSGSGQSASEEIEMTAFPVIAAVPSGDGQASLDFLFDIASLLSQLIC